MIMSVTIGEKYTGTLFNNRLKGEFIVVFITKQNSNIIRLRNSETGIEKLINLEDPRHDLTLCD